jgi:hypothetical protein
MLLGGLIAAMVCGVVSAKPPTGPLSEGREVDPVVRDFYQGHQPTPPAGTADPAQNTPVLQDPGAWPLLTVFTILDSILGGMTIPLGPLYTNGM